MVDTQFPPLPTSNRPASYQKSLYLGPKPTLVDHVLNSCGENLVRLPTPQEQSTPKVVECTSRTLPDQETSKSPLIPLSPIVVLQKLTGTEIARGASQTHPHLSRVTADSLPPTVPAPLLHSPPPPHRSPPLCPTSTREGETTLTEKYTSSNQSASEEDFVILRGTVTSI